MLAGRSELVEAVLAVVTTGAVGIDRKCAWYLGDCDSQIGRYALTSQRRLLKMYGYQCDSFHPRRRVYGLHVGRAFLPRALVLDIVEVA